MVAGLTSEPGIRPLDLSSHCLAITEHAPWPMATVAGARHIVRSVNPAFCRLMDKPMDQIVGRPFYELLPPKDESERLLDRVFQTGISETYTEEEFPGRPPVFWSYTIWPVWENKRLVAAMIQVTETAQFREKTLALNEALVLGSVRQHELTEAAEGSNAQLQVEITERQKTALALAEKARLLDLSNDAIIVRDMEGRIRYWNHGAEKLYGWPREEVLGKVSHVLLQSEFPTPLEQMTEELHRNNRWTGELVHTTREGRRITVLARKSLDRDAQGNPAAVLQTLTDITERKQAEKTSNRLAAIVEFSDDAIIGKDLDGILQSWNAGAEKIFGYSAAEMVGGSLRPLIPAERWEEENHILKKIRGGESVLHFETVRQAKNGRRIDVSVTVSPIKDSTGKIVGASKVARDITERKRVEKALLESEERFRALLTASSDVVYRMNPDWSEMRQLDGMNFIVDMEKPSGNWLHRYIPPDDQPQVLAVITEAIRTKRTFELEHRVRRVDGTLGWTFSRAVPLFDAKGEIVEWFGAASDVTERKHAQVEIHRLNAQLEQRVLERTAQLQTANEELEAFSYSISHDMRAPLRAMQSYGQFLLDEYDSKLDEQGVNYLQQIMRSAVRLDRLIQDVLSYTRILHSPLPMETVDLDRLVRDIVETCPIGEMIKPQIQIHGKLPEVMGNEGLLTQCVSNLLSNGAKFVSPGTTPRLEISAEEREESVVRVWFKDNGIGIAPENHERIFRLSERIHPDTEFEGTGIGLTIVRKAIERMGAGVGFESELGKGSQFWIQLKKS